MCSSCNCEIYHLSYQEELWAATEEKSQGGKPSKSKKKKQKKKEKEKEKKKQQAKSKDGVDPIPDPGKEDIASESAASRSGGGVKASSSAVPLSARISGTRSSGDRNVTSNEDDSLNQSFSVSSGSYNGSLGQDEAEPQLNRRQLSGGEGREVIGRDLAAGPKGKDEAKRREKEGGDSIDFVLYLQQTGSIIALSKLMDALDYD